VHQLVGLLGEDAAVDAVLAHRQTYIADADLALMRAEGLTSVRLPLGWWAFCGDDACTPHNATAAAGPSSADSASSPDAAPAALLRPGVVRDPAYGSDRAFVCVTPAALEAVVSRVAAAGLTVLLDLHAFPGGSSDGSYNGVYPKPPVFFEEPELMALGLKVVANLCAFYNRLPPYLQAAVSGVTLMNEPAHLLPSQSSEMVGWLADACGLFRTLVVAPAEAQAQAAAAAAASGASLARYASLPFGGGVVPPPHLFVNFIETSLDRAEMVNFMATEFTLLERSRWAVLDVHHYLAWDPSAAACLDPYGADGSGCAYACAADLDLLGLGPGTLATPFGGASGEGQGGGWRNWTSAVAEACAGSTPSLAAEHDSATVPLVACSEWSLATFPHSRQACRGADALGAMFEHQTAAFQASGLVATYFWTWRMPFGGSHEQGWSLKHHLTGLH
jgi:hypothetical protein